jgi:hypothetical protein
VEDFRALFLAPVLNKSTKISPDTYRALNLGGSSGAELHSDKVTAPKRIWAFLKLCAKFIPCEHEAYDLAVAYLDAELDIDVSKARTVLKITQEQFLPVIVKAQNEAVSVLLQVLYSLHQGHVQFLSGDYRARVLDVHGPDAFRKRAPRLGKDELPHTFLDNHALVRNPEQAVVDMSRLVDISKDDDPESPVLEDSGSPIHYTNGDEEDKANTPVPYIPQMEASRPQARDARRSPAATCASKPGQSRRSPAAK